ncbi:MAG: 4Fe-4S binding protein [Gordonibacter sp.]|uniref:4Fe-4S dicluster domain-containing protein n=1 Tax=Gordonibacter sp. TaxID=1968902 RepID=UPI002FC7C132
MLGAYPVSRKFVMADPSVCIGCKTCLAACLVRHDVSNDVAVPRLALVTTRTISAPVGCHHCAEAPCADACPTGCLYVDDEHVGVYPDKCIGCRNCVLACPYGAVDIVTRPAPPEPAPSPKAEDAATAPQAAGEEAARIPDAKATDKPKPSARDRVRARAKKRRSTVSTVVKCDLCIDHADGPACAAACPTKALRLIDPQMLERGKQAKRKAAARAAASFATITLNADLDEER